MPVTREQARQELARRELTRREQARAATPEAPTHPLESDLAKTFFPGVGGLLGGMGGGALGGMAGGIGAAPGMAAGGMTGAAAGEGARQFLSGMTGGPRRTATEALRGQLGEAITEGVGMGVGKAIPAAARLAGRAGRAATTRLGSMATGVSPQSIQRVFQRGAKQIVTPEFQEFAKGGIPETIRTKVIEGFNRFRTGHETRYDQALAALKPRLERTTTNLIPALDQFSKRLVEGNFLTSEMQPHKAVVPLLGKDLAPEAAKSAQKLTGILKRIEQIATVPRAGMTEVGILPTEQAVRLKRELDTLLDFDPNAIQKMTKPAQAVLLGLRTALREATEAAVPELAEANGDYHLFRDLYDVIQPQLHDPTIETTLRQLTRNKNTFNFRMLQDVDQQLAPDERFLNQVLDVLAGSEFGKEPNIYRALLPGTFGMFQGFAGQGPVGGAVGLLLGMGATSPRVFGRGLRAAEAVAKPLTRAGRAVQPAASAAAPFTLRALRQEAE